MILFLISFVAGILTVLAPCVLPLLPVIVGGSMAQGGGWRRAYTICISLGLSVIAFTLLLKATTAFIAVPEIFWTALSGAVLVLFGLVMIFPSLWDSLSFVARINRSSNALLSAGYQKQSLWGDVLMGAALGPVFSSCSPTYFVILATVLPASFAAGIADLLAYAVGLSGFLLIIAIVGQRLVERLGVTIEPGGWFRRAIGVLFIVIGLAIFSGYEAKVERYLFDKGFDATRLEQYLLGAPMAEAQNSTSTVFLAPEIKARVYPKAPELVQPDGYINTDGKPITIGQFKGEKVVLIDIWTYSCINCQRTLPYIKAWYEKYRDQGLEIIGVHTPEFAFEHVYSNVLRAVQEFGLKYPVVLDNEYRTWNAFGNQFWPRKYLIDIDGYIVYDHAGEGNYDETEKAIQRALSERAHRLGAQMPPARTTAVTAPTVDSGRLGSPETYFGAARNEYLGNGETGTAGTQFLHEQERTNRNTLYLIGQWDFADEYAATGLDVGGSAGSDRVDYLYQAKNVYFVAGAPEAIEVEVLQDGKPLAASATGEDVYFKDGRSYVRIQENRLYHLVGNDDYESHLLELIISKPRLQAYTFTFG